MISEYKMMLITAIFLILVVVVVPTSVNGKTPNVLFIVIDDLRPALGAYGDENAHTPNIDELAAKSFVFNNAYAQQALCAPSRNSFLTSRRPDSLRLYDFYSFWRDTVGNYTTLPQHFRDNGYYTQSIGKIFHPGISSNYTDDSLYSWSDVPFHPKTQIYKDAKVCVNSDGALSDNLICPVIVKNQPGGTLPDIESLIAASSFLENHQTITHKPFFLAVGFHKPHVPLKFPVHFLKYHPIDNVTLPSNRWRNYALPTVAWNPWTDLRARDDIKKLNISFPFGVMPDYVTKQIIRNYNAATTYIDDLIGQLLANIQDKDNTIIVFTADHGWSRSEHGEFSKFSNFDVATRIPLIIHVPGLNTKQITVENLVELVDLFPTLVDLTQISQSLSICDINGSNSKLCTEGTSLVPLMTGATGKQSNKYLGKRAVFTQYPRPGPYPTSSPNSDKPRLNHINIMGYSIRTNRYRYTEWVKFNHSTFKADWDTTYGVELYDHLIDPDENLNIAARSELNYVTASLRKSLVLGWRYAGKRHRCFLIANS